MKLIFTISYIYMNNYSIIDIIDHSLVEYPLSKNLIFYHQRYKTLKLNLFKGLV